MQGHRLRRGQWGACTTVSLHLFNCVVEHLPHACAHDQACRERVGGCMLAATPPCVRPQDDQGSVGGGGDGVHITRVVKPGLEGLLLEGVRVELPGEQRVGGWGSHRGRGPQWCAPVLGSVGGWVSEG